MRGHRLSGANGIASRNGRDDFRVIRCALEDQVRLILRTLLEILKIKPQCIEAVGDTLQHGVAGDLGNPFVEAGVQDSEADMIFLNGCMRVDDCPEIVNV